MMPERTDWLRSCSPSAEKAENPPSPVLIETGLPCFPEPSGQRDSWRNPVVSPAAKTEREFCPSRKAWGSLSVKLSTAITVLRQAIPVIRARLIFGFRILTVSPPFRHFCEKKELLSGAVLSARSSKTL